MAQLYEYTYLTCSQMETLWFSKSKKTLYRILKSLRERNLIKSTSYKYSPKEGRLEDVHFLTIKWYAYMNIYLGENKKEKKIKIHKWFYEDYDHRTKTISCKIALQNSAIKSGLEILNYYQYFENGTSKSRSRQRSTKIIVHDFFLIPDSVIKLAAHNKQTLFCLEYHKGYRIKKIEKQIKQYVLAIAAWTPSYTFDVDTNAIVLLVFEQESTMNSTIERISENSYYENFKESFLFKSYQDLIKEPLQHRTNLKHEKISIWEFLK